MKEINDYKVTDSSNPYYCGGSTYATGTLAPTPKPIGNLYNKYTKQSITVYRKFNWFQLLCIRFCFGMEYEKINN